jgi:hypothetical protein
MVAMSGHLAERLVPLGTNNRERLTAAWRLALGREPEADEIAPLINYADRHGLANACRLIFNLNEFTFID